MIDETTMKRGHQTTHVACGVPATVACCEYVNFMTLEKILALDHPDAMKIYIEAGLIGYRGQASEVYMRNADIECPTLSEYLVLTCAKTISVNMIFKLMRLFSSFEMDLSYLTYLLGKLQ
jgi:geranylgeranyl diphosphate synthase type 3